MKQMIFLSCFQFRCFIGYAVAMVSKHNLNTSDCNRINRWVSMAEFTRQPHIFHRKYQSYRGTNLPQHTQRNQQKSASL